ncbi:MAG: translation initiation factor IF-3 [Clostridiales bacterium]|nr:translation initiation factor IF-3 [Clostridiales bacterium]
MKSKELFVNERIRDREVRVIDVDGGQLGIMPTNRALDIAYQKQLDLVKVAPNSKPPVCRIMDYGKYKFDMEKRDREARKKQKVVNVKEVRLSATIEEHDLGVKARNADKFLKSGDKVKVSIRFRGREMAHTNIGYEIMDKFQSMLTSEYVVQNRPRMEGRNMTMMLESDE